MMSRFRDFFQADIAMDIGTANTRIYVPGKGVVIDEPSVICIRRPGPADPKTASTHSVGEDARRALGRLPTNIDAFCPIEGGVIAHFAEAQRMLKEFIAVASAKRALPGTLSATVGVPHTATHVERRALREAVLGAGVANVKLLEKPIAAALGSGLPTDDPIGAMVVDIGAGVTEVGVMALGRVAYMASARVGGNAFDRAIIGHLRHSRGLLIGAQTAERLKRVIGYAVDGESERYIEVTGHNVSAGVPRTTRISSLEVCEALTEPLNRVVSLIKSALDGTSAELVTDIAHRGMILTGGSAQLRAIDRLLTLKTGLRVRIAAEPMSCVVRGMGIASDSLQPYAFE
jgi:rod shape-determining protein MreB